MEGSHRHSTFGFLLKTRTFPIFYLNKTDISVLTAKSKQIPIFCTCCGQNCQRSMKRSKMIKNHEPYLNRILKESNKFPLLDSRINLIACTFSRVQFDVYLKEHYSHYSNGLAKGWRISYAANLRKWCTDFCWKT